MGTDWDESFAGGRVIMMRLYRVPDLGIPLLFHRAQPQFVRFHKDEAARIGGGPYRHAYRGPDRADPERAARGERRALDPEISGKYSKY